MKIGKNVTIEEGLFKVNCDCQDWKENIDKINGNFLIAHIHGMGGYTGKPFKLCPWCGKELKNAD